MPGLTMDKLTALKPAFIPEIGNGDGRQRLGPQRRRQRHGHHVRRKG